MADFVNVKVIWKNSKPIIERLGNLESIISQNIFKAMKDFGNRIVRTSKKDYLSGPRPSRLGVLSGRLRASITFSLRQAGSKFILEPGTNVPYGRKFEEEIVGGRSRKFLEPAIDDNRKFFTDRMLKGLRLAADGKLG